jgi:phosphoglycerate dehydrogenase-like enzyme
MTASPLTILIASPLEEAEVERIRAFAPGRVEVMHAPELLPRPRYAADHHGVPPDLAPAEVARWQGMLARADITFDFDWRDAAALPRSAPRLRWVQATSAGIGEFIAAAGLAGSGIIFTTASGVHAQPLGEFVILGLLFFFRQVPWLLRMRAERRWQRYTSGTLDGARVLVVGLGSVGREAARRCAAFGMEVWGVRRRAGPEPPVEGVSRFVPADGIAAALPEVDALVLACPLTAETRGLIDRRAIAVMRPGAVIVNVARGGVIDEEAMIEALEAGRLGGAALDVAAVEPLPAASRLWDLDTVLISPHSASTVAAENRRIVDIFLDNLGRFLEGRPLRNVFDAARGY